MSEHLSYTGDGRLAFRDSGGSGPVVILLHPATGSLESWPHQLEAFAAAGYRVIAYSRLGHLGSAPADPDDPGHASDDLHALLDDLALDRVHLVGEAAGGIYATDYTLTHPERVASLVIACSIMGISEPDWTVTLDRLIVPGLHDLPASFVELSPAYRVSDPAGLREWERLLATACSGDGFVKQTTRTAATWQTLSGLDLPVLLISGGADHYAPTPLMAEAARHIPGAAHVAVPDAGHVVSWERPEEFNAAVLGFLDRHAR